MGTLNLYSTTASAYSQADLSLSERVANQVAGAVANAQLYEESLLAEETQRRLARENEAMAEIGRVINQSPTFEGVYPAFAAQLRNLIPFDFMNVNILDFERDTLTLVYVERELAVPGRAPGTLLPLPGTFTQGVAGSSPGMIVQSQDPDQIAETYPGLAPFVGQGLRSFLGVPLIARGETIATLHLYSLQSDAYAESHLDLALRTGAQIAGAIANAQLYDRLEKEEHALKESYERIRELAAEAIDVQEQEQERVGIELHDRVTQTLASAHHFIQTAAHQGKRGQDNRETLDRSAALLREAIQESRVIMNELYPPALRDFGLVPLLDQELNRLKEALGCRVVLDVDCPDVLPQKVEVVLFRVAQEALTNVRKHAPKAKRVDLSLSLVEDVASLRIGDNGPGFDQGQAGAGQRVGGLSGMRRRAELLRGSCNIESAIGEGTTVHVTLPLLSPEISGGGGGLSDSAHRTKPLSGVKKMPQDQKNQQR